LIVGQLMLINSLQNGDKVFNEELVRLDTCDHIISILRLPFASLSEEIIAQLLLLIIFLCRYDGILHATSIESHFSILDRSGMCEILASFLTTHIDKLLIVKLVCKTIWCFATGKDKEIRLKLESLGVCESLVRVLYQHQNSDEVMEAAVLAVTNLCLDNGWHIHVKFLSLGACEILMELLSRHYKDNAKIAHAVSGAVTNMSGNPTVLSKFVS